MHNNINYVNVQKSTREQIVPYFIKLLKITIKYLYKITH